MAISKKSKNQPTSQKSREVLLRKKNHQLEGLSYEEALGKLESILNKLQNETLAVEDLQDNYVNATLYLEYCENLLKTIEQEVVEMEIENSRLKDT